MGLTLGSSQHYIIGDTVEENVRGATSVTIILV